MGHMSGIGDGLMVGGVVLLLICFGWILSGAFAVILLLLEYYRAGIIAGVFALGHCATGTFIYWRIGNEAKKEEENDT